MAPEVKMIKVPLYKIDDNEPHFEYDELLETQDPLLVELVTKISKGLDVRRALYLGVLRDFVKFKKENEIDLWAETVDILKPSAIQVN